MNGLYAQYCIHNQPIYNQKYCSGCRAIREKQAKKRYHAYWNKQRGHFWDYFKEAFGGDPRDPDTPEHKIPEEFMPLRKSKSQEELRKNYFKLARIHHPDKGGEKTMFQRLQNCYERLCKKFF